MGWWVAPVPPAMGVGLSKQTPLANYVRNPGFCRLTCLLWGAGILTLG